MGKPLDVTSQRQRMPHMSNWLHWHPPRLDDAGAPRKDPESEWLAEDNQRTNPVTRKPKTVNQVAQQSSWILSSSCPPPGVGAGGGGLPNQVSCLVSTGVSWNNSFPSVTREPPLKPSKGSPFLQQGDTQERIAIRKARTIWEGSLGENGLHV